MTAFNAQIEQALRNGWLLHPPIELEKQIFTLKPHYTHPAVHWTFSWKLVDYHGIKLRIPEELQNALQHDED